MCQFIINMSVQTVLRQSNSKFRPEKNGDNLDKFNARLLDLKASSDLISLARCHEDGRCQTPINSFLSEVKAEGVLGSSWFYAQLPPISFW